jgi:hypothetical protein
MTDAAESWRSADPYAEALRDELANTRERIASFLHSGDQILTLLVTIAVGAGAALAARPSSIVAVLVPFGLVIPTAYTVRLNALIQHLGGYRKALEVQLNERLPHPVYVWEARIAPIVKRPTSQVTQAVFVVVWGGLVAVAAISFSRAEWPRVWLIPLLAAYTAVIVLAAVGIRKGNALFDETYDATMAALNPGA